MGGPRLGAPTGERPTWLNRRALAVRLPFLEPLPVGLLGLDELRLRGDEVAEDDDITVVLLRGAEDSYTVAVGLSGPESPTAADGAASTATAPTTGMMVFSFNTQLLLCGAVRETRLRGPPVWVIASDASTHLIAGGSGVNRI